MTFDFGEALARMLADGMRASDGSTPGRPPAPQAGQELLLDKQACYIQVPNELLMDCGVIPDTRTHKPPSRRDRIRWSSAAPRDRATRWAYRRIAGYDVPESG
jgi:hypothetical protein